MKHATCRAIVLLAAGTVLAVLAAVTPATAVTVKVDGKRIEIDGPLLRIATDYKLLPAVSYLEGLGARVTWDANTQQITAVKGDMRLIMVIGQDYVMLNGARRDLPVGAQTISGKPYVPVVTPARAFGFDVDWDEGNLTLTLTTKPDLPEILAVTTPGYTRPLKAGEQLQIQIKGTPGCQATATLGEAGEAIALAETQRGTYLAKLQVEEGMDFRNLRIAGRLIRGNETSEVIYSANTIAIDTLLPKFSHVLPARDTTVANASPVISVNYEDRGGSGLNLTTVRVFLDRVNATQQAQVRADNVTLTTHELPLGQHTVKVTVEDLAGNANFAEWQFSIALAPGTQIRSVRHDAAGPLTAGDTLTVTMDTVAPGRQATFDIGQLKTGLAMSLQAGTNTYVGTYAVAQNDQVTNAVVTCHFVAANGAQHSLAAGTPVTITPQLPTKLEIRSPKAGETTARVIKVSGSAPPGTRVRYTISYVKIILAGELTSAVLQVGQDGNWESDEIDLKIPLLKMADKYTLRCELLDAQDEVVDQQQVEFTARE